MATVQEAALTGRPPKEKNLGKKDNQAAIEEGATIHITDWIVSWFKTKQDTKKTNMLILNFTLLL